MALAERMFHMKHLDPEFQWGDCAVLARQHAVLEPIRALLEHRGIPLVWTADRDHWPSLPRIREIASFLRQLRELRSEVCRASQLRKLLAGERGNPWRALMADLLAEWREETGNRPQMAGTALEFLSEALVERGRDPSFGWPTPGQENGAGVRLATVHVAKGLEFRHFFLPDGGWETGPNETEEENRRLYYVGMTRARDTLHLLQRHDRRNPHLPGLEGSFLERDRPSLELPEVSIAGRRFAVLRLADLFLGFAGRFAAAAPIHERLAALQPGDELRMCPADGYVELADRSGEVVATLSEAGRSRWGGRLETVESVRVLAMVERRSEDATGEYRDRLRCERWEVPVAEVVYRSPAPG